jgi:hypothetical protein
VPRLLPLGPWRRFLLGTLALILLAPSVLVAAPPAVCHRVRSGDTLFALAQRYRTTVERLRALNHLRPGEVLRPRMLLIVRKRRGRPGKGVVVGAQPLRARPDNLTRENAAADRHRLSRLRDDRMLGRFLRAGLLVPVPAETATYWLDGVRPAHRVARPWTRRFLAEIAGAFHGVFGSRLKVTGLTRTAQYQRRLRLVNGNAAPAGGDTPSAHLTGAAVDISTRDVSRPERTWLRRVLRLLRGRQVLLAIEEFRQPHFHVLVLPPYVTHARAAGDPFVPGGC